MKRETYEEKRLRFNHSFSARHKEKIDPEERAKSLEIQKLEQKLMKSASEPYTKARDMICKFENFENLLRF